MEFWSYYSIAPVFAVLHSSTGADWIKEKVSDSAICVESGSEASYTDDLTNAFNQCKELYSKKLSDDVVPAFNQFDKDKSGAIDKTELRALMKNLGQEINEEQSEDALKDLDLNKDGVIDIDEFKRWYFTGMKPYNGSRRTMLKVGAKSKKLVDAIKDEARNALLCEDLKTKHNKVSIGFNAPENPKTTIKVNINMGGHD
jgi:hypothetical protein